MTAREHGVAAGTAVSGRDLRALPKAELHLHLLAATLAERGVSMDVCLTPPTVSWEWFPT